MEILWQFYVKAMVMLQSMMSNDKAVAMLQVGSSSVMATPDKVMIGSCRAGFKSELKGKLFCLLPGPSKNALFSEDLLLLLNKNKTFNDDVIGRFCSVNTTCMQT